MAYKNIEDHRAYHREYMKQYRRMLKDNRMCVCCGKQDAFTIVGRKICYDCLVKYHKKTGYKFRKPKKRKVVTIPRNERSNYGLCYICGKTKTNIEKKWSLGENKLCKKCYQRILKTAKQTYKKELKLPICQTQKAMENFNKLKTKNELENEEKYLQKNEKSKQCVI